MKKFTKYLIGLFIISALFYLVYISSNKRTTNVFQSLEPKLYEKLISKNNLNTINKSKNNDYFNIKIENSYCDKNMFVLSILIDYKKSSNKVKPIITLKNKPLLNTASMSLNDLEDKYLFLVVPQKNIKDKINIDIEFLNPLQVGMDKNISNPFYTNINLDIYKNINDDNLKEFELTNPKGDILGKLNLTPYGMFMKVYDETKTCNLGIKYNKKEFLPTSAAKINDEIICVFDDSIVFDYTQNIKNTILVNFYSNSIDENLLKSIEFQLK